MSAAELNYMLKIVTGLLSRRESAIFREPVDHKGLGLKDYPDIVKEPRDLGTIKKKIEISQERVSWRLKAGTMMEMNYRLNLNHAKASSRWTKICPLMIYP